MDAHLPPEEYDIGVKGDVTSNTIARMESSKWSFTSKVLLLSNILVGILIIIIFGFLLFSSASDGATLNGELNSEKPILKGLEKDVLSVVNGCLDERISGIQCDQAFLRADIEIYCDSLNDERCYVLAALMNENKDYCSMVSNDVLKEKCLN